MKLGIMQPYFFPYIGYWQLLNYVDQYVIYDDVTYIKGGWINRNNFLINGEKKLFSIALSNAGSNTLIKDIEIKDDFVKFIKMLQTNYAKAPYFKDVFPVIQEIVSFQDKNLAAFLINSHKVIASYLDMQTKIIISSQMVKDLSLRSSDKVLDICNNLQASNYINAIGGKDLYDKNEFIKNGVILEFLQSEIVPYNQYKNEFIPGLSIIDVIMFNSKEIVIRMLNRFSLV